MTARSVFVTGATGFIGRRFVQRLAGGEDRVQCLCRRPGELPARDGLEIVLGDIRERSTYAERLRGTEVVIHLAGVTGKARTADYMAVNADGTRVLLDACRAAGVRRFVYVSSIAATYSDTSAYPYARSKQIAEHAVRSASLDYLIVRPTIVLGPASPIWQKLQSLARLPVMPIPGNGRVRVQPIYVDDVVTFVMAMLQEETFADRAVDLGGPDVLTFEDLLRRVRHRLVDRDRPTVHVPVNALMWLLRIAEPWAYPVLPVTAGQLSAFIYESTAAADPIVGQKVPRMTSVNEMIRMLSVRG
jgi:NADH dehydrogenase